ncbi:MAG: hypothetical protein ACRDTS_23465, partial [Mycobacterium sp.]
TQPPRKPAGQPQNSLTHTQQLRAKSLSELKLETPLMLLASLLGWFGILSLTGRPAGTPLEIVGRANAWLG